ncbi:FUSC family protein [Metapseudomonas lalkuanensis]|uniref:FUSC family protein n=1 Tax=Metapseudomonas lalkuanensis TaxID=2604832 RepID=A0A5J6QPS3_9GAMM|nr:FUSC family protein [Pseudomonas lalkuanensis]QEY64327.1 FUSC family protein [Pseudomonas lalkuanensis]
MRETLRAFVAPDIPALQFAIKTLLGGALALWCAFRFDLQQPQWALMTAFIVAQPLSGMVVQKGLARLLGTLVGTVMSVTIVGLFAQTPWLFLLALATWLGICTAASTMMRSAWSYSFVLAGYTVAIIGLPAIAHPLTVFDQAVARSTEICLGIICATLTSALLWPQRVERQLARQARDAWQCGIQASLSALKGERQERQGLLGVLGRIVAVDAQREHAWFEGNRGRQRAVALQVLSRDLLSLLRLARGVARQWRQLGEGEAERLRPWLEEVELALAEPDPARLDDLRDRLLAASEDEALTTVQQYCLGRMAMVMRQASSAVTAMHAVEQGQAPTDAPPPLSTHRDVQTAAIYGLRSGLAFLGLSAFWLATAWTSAVGALTLTCVICGLFASRENAEQIGMMFLRGIVYALPVAFIVGQVFLPQLSGFPMLCMALGVPLFFGALGMAKPALGATATSFCLHFIVLCAPQNLMRFDVGLFLNEAISMLLGVGFAVFTFRLIPLRNPVWHGRRLLKASLSDLARLTGVRLAGAENWFGGRMADRLLQLARLYPVLPEQSRSRWDDGIASLDLGDELLHLRRCLAAADRSLGVSEDRFLRNLERVLMQGPAPGRAQALDEPVGDLLEALRGAGRSIDRRLAQAALLQLQQSWRQWCEQQEASHGLA